MYGVRFHNRNRDVYQNKHRTAQTDTGLVLGFIIEIVIFIKADIIDKSDSVICKYKYQHRFKIP
jgi:hypothetical protein